MKINSMQSLPTVGHAYGLHKKDKAPVAANANTTTGQGAPVQRPAAPPPPSLTSTAGLDTFAAFQAAKSAIASRTEEATASATSTAAPKPAMSPEMTRTMGGLNTALALVQATSQQLMSWDFMSKEPAEPLWAQEGARSYQAVQDAPKASALWETLAEA